MPDGIVTKDHSPNNGDIWIIGHPNDNGGKDLSRREAMEKAVEVLLLAEAELADARAEHAVLNGEALAATRKVDAANKKIEKLRAELDRKRIFAARVAGFRAIGDTKD